MTDRLANIRPGDIIVLYADGSHIINRFQEQMGFPPPYRNAIHVMLYLGAGQVRHATCSVKTKELNQVLEQDIYTAIGDREFSIHRHPGISDQAEPDSEVWETCTPDELVTAARQVDGKYDLWPLVSQASWAIVEKGILERVPNSMHSRIERYLRGPTSADQDPLVCSTYVDMVIFGLLNLEPIQQQYKATFPVPADFAESPVLQTIVDRGPLRAAQ